VIARAAWALGGALAWCVGAWLMAQHPGASLSWAWAAGALAVLGAWRPAMGGALVLALLPVADVGIFSGWRHFSVFDILMAWVCGGMWLRRAWRTDGPSHAPLAAVAAWSAWVLIAVCAWWRAPVAAWGPMTEAFWGDHLTWSAPWLGLKSLIWALALVVGLWPWRGRAGLARTLSWGMVAGLTLNTLAAMFERASQVGLLNLALPYRTTAWFWEMNVGGGALDAYLAMSLPFGWWACRQVRSPLAWSGLACLMVASVYVVVTTYSRGILVTGLLIGWASWMLDARRRLAAPPAWRRADAWLNGVLAFEAVALVLVGSFVSDRLTQSSADAVSRWHHWQDTWTLARTPSERLAGIGLGQLPQRYSRDVPGGEMPGGLRWVPASPGEPAHVRISGAPREGHLAGRFALLQRMPNSVATPHAVALRWRAERAVRVRLAWCEQHLLYEGRCQETVATLQASTRFRVASFALTTLSEGDVGGATWRPGATRVFKLAVLDVGARFDLGEIELWGATGRLPVLNSTFEHGLAHWWSASRAYFLPWHADNLYLEIVTERGVLGLLAWLALVAVAWRGARRAGLDHGADPWLLAVGALSVLGALISMMEFPRTAFLAQFLVAFPALLGGISRAGFIVRS
jgi:hypothetical protein